MHVLPAPIQEACRSDLFFLIKAGIIYKKKKKNFNQFQARVMSKKFCQNVIERVWRVPCLLKQSSRPLEQNNKIVRDFASRSLDSHSSEIN